MELTTTPSIPWVEKYRPSKFQDIVLDPLNRRLFQQSLDAHYFPNMLFYGPPGTGKTTTVINLINEYQTRHNGGGGGGEEQTQTQTQTKTQRSCVPRSKSTIIHLNASDERGIDIIRNQIQQFVRSLNLFEPGLKFVILDEVDYMTKLAQQALKYILQTSSSNVRFCLICNYITKIDEALKQEFLCIRFNQLPKRDITQFIQQIAQAEHLHINEEWMENLQDQYHSDIRSMINYMQMNQHLLSQTQSTSPRHNHVRYLNSTVLEDLYHSIWSNSSCGGGGGGFLRHKLYGLSVEYNMDQRAILQKMFHHIVRHRPDLVQSKFLEQMELFLHRQDIPVEISLDFWCA